MFGEAMELLDWIAYSLMLLGALIVMFLLRDVFDLPRWLSILLGVLLGPPAAVVAGSFGIWLKDQYDSLRNRQNK